MITITLYFLINYNNYFNRIVKYHNTIQNYANNCDSFIEVENVYGFNPNDGVNTSHILNNVTLEEIPDYMIVTEGANILQRWFVTEAKRERNGQYTISLRRDLICENLNSVLSSPCFVEKGYVKYTDSAVFNPENVQVSQVKKSQTPLYDSTGIPWIVGFIKKGNEETDNKRVIISSDVNYDIEVNTLDDLGFKNGRAYKDYPSSITYKMYVLATASAGQETVMLTNAINNTFSATTNISTLGYDSYILMSGASAVTTANVVMRSLWNTRGSTNELLSIKIGTTDFNSQELLALNNKYIYTKANNKIYKASVTTQLESGTYRGDALGVYNEWKDLTDSYKSIYFESSSNATYNTFFIDYTRSIYQITYTEVSSYDYSYADISLTKHILNDAPYSMFFLPLGTYKVGGKQYTSSESLLIAKAISSQLSSNLMDLMILPYCPVPSNISNGNIVLNNLTYATIRLLSQSTTIDKYIPFCKSSSFTLQINQSLSSDNYKVDHLTKMWRLCSPGYNSVFEFDVPMNGGVSSFLVNATYKPYQPYVRINPSFKSLYGANYKDNRGLILSGDFSLPQTSSAWEEYLISNKNYANQFNREIENMDINRKYQRTSEILSAATGAFGLGGAIGATMGNAALGIGTGVLSAGAGIADIYFNEKLYNESKDYKQDMYGFNLSNIKAIPNTLTKSSAWNIDSQYVPFIELYQATDEEIEAVKNKIKYNGMSVNRIGILSDYIKNDINELTYIKGSLIRLLNYKEDTNYLNEIANEVYKGVYIDGSYSTIT